MLPIFIIFMILFNFKKNGEKMKNNLLKTTLLSSAVFISAMSFNAMADGKGLYASLGCAACHGAAGISANPTWPNLAGQKATYTVKQLKDFQSGARKDATMNAMAALTAGKEQAIADYLASLK